MLPPDAPFLETALALLALPFRPVTAGVSPVAAGLPPTLWSEARRLRHARRTSSTSGTAGGLKYVNRSKRLKNHGPPKRWRQFT
jgi:hypothetical protein